MTRCLQLVFLSAGFAAYLAQSAQLHAVPDLSTLKSQIKAQSVLLVDNTTGAVLFEKGITQKHYPASTVKLLTALIVWEKTKLKGSVTVAPEDTWVEPSHIPLRAGETVEIRDLVYSLLIGSDNDSAMALAHAVSGSVKNFSVLMNTRARELGCLDSYFTNPHGLPDAKQKVTARDMLKIFNAAIAVPELRKICKTKRFKLKTRARTQIVKNHNKLLGVYPGMGPAKTGWTYASRHTYAAAAEQKGHELHLIILKSPDKWSDARALFDFGFAHLPGRENLAQRSAVSNPAIKALAANSKSSSLPVSSSSRSSLKSEPTRSPYLDERLLPLPAKRGFIIAATHTFTPVETQAPPLLKYIVRPGDTLYHISKRHGRTIEDILNHNSIPDPDSIRPGMVLYIPKNVPLQLSD